MEGYVHGPITLRRYYHLMKSPKEKLPFVTVAIPAFNHEKFIKDAIESVLTQKYSDWELIIIDDGSTDNTGNIADLYKDHPKVTVIHQQNVGLSKTLNRALETAKGTFFNFLPSDDFFHKDKLFRQCQVLQAKKDEGFACIFCDQIPVDASGNPIKGDEIENWHSVTYATEKEILPKLFERNFIPAPSALIRTDAIREVGGFDETLTYTQDYDLWLKILPRYKALWLHEALLYYRWHGENLTFQADESINFERAYVLTKALTHTSITEIFPDITILKGTERKKAEAKGLIELSTILLKSGLIELFPWIRLFLHKAKKLDPTVHIPDILLKRLEKRKEFLDIRDNRLLELAKKAAILEGELANYKVHAESVSRLVAIKEELARYKSEIPNILEERKAIEAQYKKLHDDWQGLCQKEKDLIKWNASLDEKYKWLENYHQDLKAKEAYLNRPQVLVTLKVISFLARFKKIFLSTGLRFWHLLPLKIRSRYGPKLKAKILSPITRPVSRPETKESDISDGNSLKDMAITREKRIGGNTASVSEQYIVDSSPLVTVVLPIYNHAASARLSIESILNQDYPNIQIVIVNDGSTDNLHEILKPYIGRDNITILEQENQKLPKALSNGFRFAQGTFLTWTSADNIMLPWQLALEVDFLIRNPETYMTYGDVEIIDEDGRPLENSNYRIHNQEPKGASVLRLPKEVETLDAVPDNFINAAFLYRNLVQQALGHYDPRLLGTEDYDYWLRTKELFNIKKIDTDRVLYQYRVHRNSLSGKFGDSHIVGNVQTLLKEHKERKKYYQKPFSVIVVTEHPFNENHPYWPIIQGMVNASSSFHIVIPDDLEEKGRLHSNHVTFSKFKSSILNCTRDKIILLDLNHEMSREIASLIRDKDVWTAVLESNHKESRGHAQKPYRKVILDDPDAFMRVAPPQREEHLLLLDPLDPPHILKKARDDRFEFWQFPWQGGNVVISIGLLQYISERFTAEIVGNNPETDFVFAEKEKDGHKRHKTIFKRPNAHFFQFTSLEQLYPILSGVSAFWAPVRENTPRKVVNELYGWALASAKVFMAPDHFKYSDDAPYWYGFHLDNPKGFEFEKFLNIRPKRRICDEFLRRQSRNEIARYLLKTANNDLFIEKKCGGLSSFKPNMPSVLTCKSKRKHVVFTTDTMDRGGLEEVVFNLSSLFDRESFRPTIACAQKGGLLEAKSRKHGLDIQIFNNDESSFRHFMDRERVQLVNCHYTDFGIQEAKLLKVPVISTIHNAYVWFDKAQREAFKKKDALIDHYIAVSSSVKQYLVEVMGISGDKVTVVPNGVDTVALQLLMQIPPRVTRKDLGIGDEDFVFLNPASIDGRKNHHTMITAMSKIRKKHKNVKLICAGNVMDEGYFSQLQGHIKELDLGNHIIFPGYVKEKADLYRLADVFFLPSIVEGWSIAKTEALYFGLPIIVTDVGGARDVITHEWVGLLVPNSFGSITELRGENLGRFINENNPGNLKVLVDAMEDMVERKDYWQSHSEERRRLVEDNYTVEHMVEKTQAVFRKFL